MNYNRNELLHAQCCDSYLLLYCLQDWTNPNNTGTWRGEIGRNFNTAQWSAWFASYQSFIYQYATLAQTLKADSMCVGMELIDASHQEALWRTTVAGIRVR
jgi:hypothetical protein